MSKKKKLAQSPHANHNSEKPTLKDNLKAFRNIPKLFRLIWVSGPWLFMSNIICRLFKSALPLALLYVGKLIIDEIIRLTSTDSEKWDHLLILVGIEVGLALFSDLLTRGINLADALLGDLFANDISVKIMRHAANMDLAQFENPVFYDKLERARRQTSNRVMLMSLILGQIQDFVTILFLGVGLVLFNPWLILVLILTLVPSFINENYFNRSNYSLTHSWTSERRELDYLRYIGASDETAKEVKIFGLSNFITDKFKILSHDYYLANRSLVIKRNVWGFVFNTLGNLGYYAAYLVIIWQTVQKILSIGDLTFLSGSFNRMQSLLQGIFSRFSSIAQNVLYLQDLFDFLELKPLIFSTEDSIPFPQEIKEGFTFEKVGFKYPNSEIWAIRGVSFTLKSGEKLALVGENGAGKTTLTKLLARLYEPDEGRILLDGKDIRSFNLEEYRKAVGVIFQDFVKFQFQAKTNIAIGRIEWQEEEAKILDAAQQSLAHGVIDKLPGKYEQMLGRKFLGGTDLSGGECKK